MATHPAGSLTTVLGDISSPQDGIVDAHNHLWIHPLPSAKPGIPVLDCTDAIAESLLAFRAGGGSSILDSQPGADCGRDGRMLSQLSRASGVHVLACTGFHRARYYPLGAGFFNLSAEQAREHFLAEINNGLEECRHQPIPARAGFIKVASEASFADTPRALVEAAASAAIEQGLLLAVHTERGADAENILTGLTALGVSASQIMLCHMDKRPDPGLHRELAQSGALLEYDTFHQAKYQPEQKAWPLLLAMLTDGFHAALAIGTDMASCAQWRAGENALTLMEQHASIHERLHAEGVPADIIQRLQTGNILGRLQRPFEPS